MSSTLKLVIKYFDKPFIFECDASRMKIGAIVIQKDHPILW